MTRGSVLLEMHPACSAHDTGRGHPERAGRLEAVIQGLQASGMAEATIPVVPRPATRHELEAVHDPIYLDAIEAFCASGGGALDGDTTVVAKSWDAALVAAGAGPDAVERLRQGEADAAFIAVRPPGHHALAERAMGFCLLNNVAITAAGLAEAGETVLIVDYDAHHGNGTQDIFYDDPRVTYVSLHEWPLFPGTGRLTETGTGDGLGRTVNLPLPSGATGDVYLAAFDEIIAPLAERIQPTWLIISAGFDAHRADPLTGLDLTAGDYADLTSRLADLVPPGRRLVVLEGGYDLDALATSASATVAALAGVSLRSESSTSGGPGRHVIDAARRLHFSPA